jgi:hypothetical protein
MFVLSGDNRGAYPPPPGWSPPAAWPPRPPAARPRMWSEIVALVVLGVAGVLVVVTGVAAYHSERHGVTGALLTVGPLGFGLAGTLVGRANRRGLHPWAWLPLLWGWAAGLIALFFAAFFFVGIFPRL